MDENFKAIYTILRKLERAMDCQEFDSESISANTLGITRERWKRIIEMLVVSGYVTGITVSRDMGNDINIGFVSPTITLKGLEYLEENALMQRAYKTAKGIRDLLPM